MTQKVLTQLALKDFAPQTGDNSSEYEWRQLLPDQVSRICIFDVVTNTRSVVAEITDVVAEAPNWHPARNELLLNADGWLWRFPLTDDGKLAGAPSRVPTGGNPNANNDHVLSPDGNTIYLSNGAGELRSVSYDGGQPELVSLPHQTPFSHYLHGVSPDGESLAYIGHDARPEVNSFEIYTLHMPSQTDNQITFTGRHHDGCEYSADGKKIYFNSERAATIPGHSQLFVMDANGANVRQLTDDERVNWFPHESPDGTRLVYLSYPSGTTGHPANLPVELRELTSNGAQPRVLQALFGGQGSINVASWAPDSRRFAYVEYPVIESGNDAK